MRTPEEVANSIDLAMPSPVDPTYFVPRPGPTIRADIAATLRARDEEHEKEKDQIRASAALAANDALRTERARADRLAEVAKAAKPFADAVPSWDCNPADKISFNMRAILCGDLVEALDNLENLDLEGT